jgi:hypothetical protein
MQAVLFSDSAMSALRDALTTPSVDPRAQTLLRDVIAQLCAEARAAGHLAEHLVTAIKTAWGQGPAPAGWNEHEWRARYEQAMAWCISVYFNEPEPIV